MTFRSNWQEEEKNRWKTHMARMLGTFNQHLPMILFDNYYSQRKPTSLPNTDMGGVPYFCAAEREMCPIY